jgi:hypothetical protein
MLKISLVFITAAALLLGISACGKSTIKESSEVDLVNKAMKQDGLTPQSVDCPDDVEAKEGETFTCNVTATNGHTGTYTIKVGNVSSDSAQLQVVGANDTTKK